MPLSKWQYLLYIKVLQADNTAPTLRCRQLFEQAHSNLLALFDDFARGKHQNKWLSEIDKYIEYFLHGNNRIKLRHFKQLDNFTAELPLYSDHDLTGQIFDNVRSVTPGVHYWRHGSYGHGQFCSNDIDIVVYIDADTTVGLTVLEQIWLRSPANVLSLVSNECKSLFKNTCGMDTLPDVMIVIYSSVDHRVIRGTHGLVDECNNANIHTVPYHLPNHCVTFKNLPAPRAVPGDLIDPVPRDTKAALRKTLASLSVMTRVNEPYRGKFKYLVNQIRDTKDIAGIVELLSTIDFTDLRFENIDDIPVGYRLKKVAVAIVQWLALISGEELYMKSEYYEWASAYPAVQRAIVRELVTDNEDWAEFTTFFSDFLECARAHSV